MQSMLNPLNAEKTALERAFELARTGQFDLIVDIRRQLRLEGFDHHQVAGAALIRQLQSISRKARAARADA